MNTPYISIQPPLGAGLVPLSSRTSRITASSLLLLGASPPCWGWGWEQSDGCQHMMCMPDREPTLSRTATEHLPNRWCVRTRTLPFSMLHCAGGDSLRPVSAGRWVCWSPVLLVRHKGHPALYCLASSLSCAKASWTHFAMGWICRRKLG